MCPNSATEPSKKSSYLRIEVEESVRTVDVVEGSKAGDGTIDVHGMDIHASSPTEDYPVRIWSTHKHLVQRLNTQTG